MANAEQHAINILSRELGQARGELAYSQGLLFTEQEKNKQLQSTIDADKTARIRKTVQK